MSDGSKFAVPAYAQQHQQNRLPFESMGNVLLDAMQGTLFCLDNSNTIVGVSKTVKRYFGFEQAELLGVSILLLIEESEKDAFSKFLNSPPQPNETYYARMTINVTNEYRQVRIQRKKKTNLENANLHSTTTRRNNVFGTILIITIEDSSYIDITLHDIHKQEFYTKMNLVGEIIFEDHRGALETGYLPHEILSQSIFDFVYHDDRLVKLHALWKCVTTGLSKLQWRLNARDGSIVFLQTEYKLISNPQHPDIIIARNEVLNPMQRSQFDELQTAWKHQCAADIKGNSSSFKFLSSSDNGSSSASNGQCRICVPSIGMCFTTDKLQPLNLPGNIFGISKLTRRLTIQDYIQVLMDNDKHMDGELAAMINNIQSSPAGYRRLNEKTKKPQQNGSDVTMDEKVPLDSSPSALVDIRLQSKTDSESIVRGIRNDSMKYNHEKQSGDSSSTLVRLLNGNGHGTQNGNTRSSTVTSQFQTNPPKSNSTPVSQETAQQQDVDFLKKYKAAKAKLESQLESIRRQETIDDTQTNEKTRRNTILNKLAQLEHIKNKHFARRHASKRQTSATATAVPVNNPEQKDFLNSLFSSSSSPQSVGLLSLDNTNTRISPIPSQLSSLFASPNDPSSYYSSNYQDQRNSSQQFDPGQTSSYLDVKPQLLDEFLTTLSSTYTPVNNNNNNSSTSLHSHMNASYQGTTHDSTSPSVPNHQNTTTYPY
ncbi:unnamed protein product [Rotaria magnacalcarata]|uniref:PAS domain-containing protein n=6 Tax=Rotaria magnacalcarata TaxID=392030 RepID=A0A814S6F9_9BILA|nr:unnamed protein product [Rotaria magnacalcarata]CAF1680123.1 unnamed protein product [Rotaria magnacalcarata]CAF2139191.1 unnamed protein product [Rotaria magnacalcarata]